MYWNYYNHCFRGVFAAFALAIFCAQVVADDNDDDFEEILFGLCVRILDLPAEGWQPASVNELNNLCNNVLENGSTPSSDYNSSSNIGSSGASSKSSSATAQAQIETVKDRIDELQEEENASGGWGLLLAAQAGGSERLDTANETGFDSDLVGVVAGGDYRHNDRLVTGFSIAHTIDDALFQNNTGQLETTSNSLVGYFTFLPAEAAYVDGYIGYSALQFDSRREIIFTGSGTTPLLTGTARGDYTGKQTMLGASTGYDWGFGQWSIGPYLSVDYHKTDVNSYDESSGSTPTGLEFSYGKQSIDSLTATLGFNLSYSIDNRWGVLVPSIAIAAIHQSKDDSRTFDLQPAFVPDNITTPINETTIFTQTDNPDRDYLLASVGVAAALNDGTQLFATYEQISGHDFLETWAISVGVLMEF